MPPNHISLSPNLQTDDLQLALAQLLNPSSPASRRWQTKLGQQLQQIFPKSKVFLFNSGRAGLQIALKSLNLPANSEVILQAFTCSAAVNPILANRLKPVYADINPNDFNLNSRLLPRLVTPQTRAIMVQHTFGSPANLKAIQVFAKKHRLFIIEDCAHSLGAAYQNKPLGSFGDLALLSFGRDKVISSVFGGAILVNNPKLLPGFAKNYSQLTYPSFSWTLQQLLHPPISWLALKTYHFQLGKFILLLSQKLKLVSKAIYPPEKCHQTPPVFPQKLPDPLARLALNQLLKLKTFNAHRQKIALLYQQKITHPQIKKPKPSPHSVYLRYNLLTPQAPQLFKYLKRRQIIAGNWYRQPITPSNNLSLAHYRKGSCPQAEKACSQSLNLPTHPNLSLKQAQQIIKLVNQFK